MSTLAELIRYAERAGWSYQPPKPPTDPAFQWTQTGHRFFRP